MTPMDHLTLHWVTIWAVTIGVPALIIPAVAKVTRRWRDGRRQDRERAARIAERVRETETLERLHAAESAGERQ